MNNKIIRHAFVILINILLSLFFCSCIGNNYIQPVSESVSSSSDEVGGAENHWYPSPEILNRNNLPKYHFDSETEILNISDDDLAFLALQPYETEDFLGFENKQIDLFGTPLNRKGDDIINGFDPLDEDESIFVCILEEDDGLLFPLSDNYMVDKIDLENENSIYPYNSQIEINNISINFVGKNEQYFEYAIRCTGRISSSYAWRKIYLRNVSKVHGDVDCYYYLGNMSSEELYNTLKLLLLGRSDKDKYVFESISEIDNVIEYKTYYIEYEITSFGKKDKGKLGYILYSVDKESRIISKKDSLIKEIDIPNTEYYMEDPI